MYSIKSHLRAFFLITFVAVVSTALYAEMVIHFIDVDWGDSIFIETPCDSTILIDGGWDDHRGQRTVDYLKALGVERIDKAIATHQHADHVGGLILVYEDQDLEVDVTYDSGYNHDTSTAARYRDLAQEHSEFKVARAFDTLDLSCDDLEMTFIHPYEGAEGPIHYMNLVLKIEYKDFSALLTGDADKDVEESMLEDAQTAGYLPSRVFKVGHHGHDDASSEEFLHAVSPEVGFIPAPESDGLPGENAIQRLRNAGIKILRGDQLGTTVVTTDGERYTTAYPDLPVAENIAELRNTHGTGDIFWLESEAVITLQGDFRGQHFIQDDTGGIVIDDDEEVLYTSYETGDSVQGLIGSVTEFRGMLQFVPYVDSGIVVSTGNEVDSLPLTIPEIEDEHQGVLITIENLTYVGEENDIFQAGRNYTFVDENDNEIELRTIFPDLDYIGEPVPQESVHITGVHNVFNNTLQIIPRELDDIVPAVQEYDAEVISSALPSRLYKDKIDSILVTYRNTGSQTWYEDGNVYLGAVGNEDDLALPENWRIGMAENVSPAQEHTFEIEIKPPQTGTFTTEWQMLKEGEFWFGETFRQEVEVLQRTGIERTLWRSFQ